MDPLNDSAHCGTCVYWSVQTGGYGSCQWNKPWQMTSRYSGCIHNPVRYIPIVGGAETADGGD